MKIGTLPNKLLRAVRLDVLIELQLRETGSLSLIKFLSNLVDKFTVSPGKNCPYLSKNSKT
jgi:hypothetical protein